MPKKTIVAPFMIVTRDGKGERVEHPAGTVVTLEADEADRLVKHHGARIHRRLAEEGAPSGRSGDGGGAPAGGSGAPPTPPTQ